MLLKWSCCCMHYIVYTQCICCPTTTWKFTHVLCSIFSAWGNLSACFLFLCILRSLNKSYLFNTSVLSISCLQNNRKPSLDERVTFLLKATDRQTYEKPDITCRLWKLCWQWARKETKARAFTHDADALQPLISYQCFSKDWFKSNLWPTMCSLQFLFMLHIKV